MNYVDVIKNYYIFDMFTIISDLLDFSSRNDRFDSLDNREGI